MPRFGALITAGLLTWMLASTSHGRFQFQRHSGRADNHLDPDAITRMLPIQEIARSVEKAILDRRSMIPLLTTRGDSLLGLPQLDPAIIGDLPINITMDGVTLEGNFSDVQAVGLRDLKLLDVRVKLPGVLVEVDIRIPTLQITGRYSLDGSFSNILSLKGSGPLEVSLTDVNLKVISQTRLYYDKLHIARVDFNLAIANSSVKLGGFLADTGFGDVVEKFIEDISGEFIHTAIKMFREDQFPSLVMRGNKFLRSFDWRPMVPNAVALYLGFGQSSSGYQGYAPMVTNKNLVDRIIQQSARYFSQRPFNIPDQSLQVIKEFFKFTLRNGVRLFPGKLFGLDSLTLIGDALISRHRHLFTFDMDLALFDLKIVLPSELTILNRRTQFMTVAHVSRMKMNVQLQFDSHNLNLQLVALHILHIGDIRVDISGLSPLELVAAPVAEYNLNMERIKQLLARQAAKLAGASVSKILSDLDLNSLVADTVNGRENIVDPNIVLADPVSNGTDISSLLNSLLGDGGSGEELTGLLALLGGDDSDDGENGDLSKPDEDTLAAFGVSGSDGDNKSLAGLDPEVLAIFGLNRR